MSVIPPITDPERIDEFAEQSSGFAAPGRAQGNQVVEAVQVALDRFAGQIVERFTELQQHAAAESAARIALEERVDAMTAPSGATPAIDSPDEAFARIAQATDEITSLVARVEEERAELRARLDRVDRRRNEASERIDAIDSRFEELTAHFDGPPPSNSSSAPTPAPASAPTRPAFDVDDEAIEELSERVSSALGQAEILRIEMDRFVETVNETLDTTTSRVVAVETAIQDQYKDVETAAQLERLEEVERMVLMLDPNMADLATSTDSVGAALTDGSDSATESDVVGFDASIDAPSAVEPANAEPDTSDEVADPDDDPVARIVEEALDAASKRKNPTRTGGAPTLPEV